MCDLTLAAAAFTAVTSYMQASNEASAVKKTAQNNQKIAEYNATVADRNSDNQLEGARDALERGANDAAVIKDNYKRATASSRAAAAGNGLVADTGTAADIQDLNTTYGEMDVLTARNNAEREAYGFKNQANDFQAEAKNLRLGGEVGAANAKYQAGIMKQNGLLSAAGTLVTGASKSSTVSGLFAPSVPSAGEKALLKRANSTAPGSGSRYYGGI